MRRSGISLVSLLVALALLALCLLYFSRTVQSVEQANIRTDKLTTAVFLGQQVIEEVAVTPKATWQPFLGKVVQFSPPYDSFGYRLSDDVSPVNSATLELLRVEVVELRESQPLLYKLETLVFKS